MCILNVAACFVYTHELDTRDDKPSHAVAYLIAFSSGWKMTLVVTASIPLMVIAGGIQASVMTGFSSQVITHHPSNVLPA